MSTPSDHRPPLLPLRTVVVLLLGVITGLVIGVLAYLAGQVVPAAIGAGIVAAGAAIVGFHQLIG